MSNKNISITQQKYDNTIFIPYEKFKNRLELWIKIGYKYEIAYQLALEQSKIEIDKIKKKFEENEKTTDSLITKVSDHKHPS